MATRSVVRIVTKGASGQEARMESAPKYIYLYHHWEGSPAGVGRELELLNSLSGYEKSDGNHGDVEYGYVIDCPRRTLTCYDLEYGRRSINSGKLIK